MGAYRTSLSSTLLTNSPLNFDNLNIKFKKLKSYYFNKNMLTTLNEVDTFYNTELNDPDFNWGSIFNKNLTNIPQVFNEDSVWDEPIDFIRIKQPVKNALSGNFEGSSSFGGYFFGHSEAHESARQAKRGQSPLMPLRIIKYPLNYSSSAQSDHLFELFRLRFNTDQKQIEMKINPHQTQ